MTKYHITYSHKSQYGVRDVFQSVLCENLYALFTIIIELLRKNDQGNYKSVSIEVTKAEGDG